MHDPSILAYHRYIIRHMAEEDRPAAKVKLYGSLVPKGNLLAMTWYGDLLVRGEGVKKDIPAGLKYIREAADAGELDAKGLLAVLLSEGEVVEKNLAESLRLHRLLADTHHKKDSMYYLGIYYQEGKPGIEKDLKLAHKYLAKSYRLGHEIGTVRYAELLIDGIGVKKDVTRALKTLEGCEKRGHGYGCYTLGSWYLHGEKIAPNPEKALRYLKLAVEFGYKPAQKELDKLQ